MGKNIEMKKATKCLLCSSIKIEDKGAIIMDNPNYPKNTRLLKCLDCRFSWINPLPNEEKLSKIYSGRYHYHPDRIKDKLLYLYNLRQLYQDYKRITGYKNSGRIMDIGAGRGDMLRLFSNKNWERWAYDPFLRKVDERVLKDKIGKHVNDYKSLSLYPAGKFDVVIIRNVIEHTSEFKKILAEVRRVLAKNGILFIRTPNIESLDYKLFKNNWYTARMGGHIVFFCKKSMEKALKMLGFKVKYCEPISYSFALSCFRSTKINLSTPIRLLISLMFSLASGIYKNGGDIIAIAKK